MLRDIVAPGDTPLSPALGAVVYISNHLLIALIRQYGPPLLSDTWQGLKNLFGPFCPTWPVFPTGGTPGTSTTSNSGSTYRAIASRFYRFTAAVPASDSNPSHTITIPEEVTPLASTDFPSSAYIDIEEGDLSG